MKRLIVIVLALSSLAYAGDKEKADSLFKQGKKLLSEKKYEQACDAFEQSQKLDPGIGTELNIGRCYEEWGKVAHAYESYKSALKSAKDANDSRADKIEGLVNQIEPSVPHLTLHIPKDADASSVRIDGQPVDDITAPIALDPGPHKVEYTTAAGGKKSKTLPIEKGGNYDANLVDLPTKGGEQVVKTPPPPPPPPPHVDETKPDPGKNFRIAAYAVGGAGVVAIGVSSYLTLSAKSKYNDALKKDCAGMTDMCNAAGLSATHSARHEANIATIVFSAGLAAVGGGVALYLLQPHESKATTEKEDEALYLVPSVTPDSAGLVFGGGF